MQKIFIFLILSSLAACQVQPRKTQPLTTQEELVPANKVPKRVMGPKKEKPEAIQDNQTVMVEDLFEKVKQRLKPDYRRFQQAGTYYSYPYMMAPSRQDSKKTWVSGEIMMFTNDDGRVKQVALVQRECGERRSEKMVQRVRERFVEFVASESTFVLGQTVRLDDGDFSRLGDPIQESQWRRTPIKDEMAGVKSMRLSGGIMKCDAQGGYGYRFDFFLKGQ